MRRLARLGSRLKRLAFARPSDDDLDEELNFHFESEVDAGLSQGLTHDAATRAAQRSFGAPLAMVRDECRESWGIAVLDDLRRDLSTGTRHLRQAPLFTA